MAPSACYTRFYIYYTHCLLYEYQYHLIPSQFMYTLILYAQLRTNQFSISAEFK